jgi:hypothetical protein
VRGAPHAEGGTAALSLASIHGGAAHDGALQSLGRGDSYGDAFPELSELAGSPSHGDGDLASDASLDLSALSSLPDTANDGASADGARRSKRRRAGVLTYALYARARPTTRLRGRSIRVRTGLLAVSDAVDKHTDDPSMLGYLPIGKLYMYTMITISGNHTVL